ncbi:TetR/AcrR family transcriptional regulator [Nocardioides dubius]|uniref:TetR/AcrR family transcriptional regulator n=1 Tax=Nocardioides dubius TaxID=317019 RepID=UPI0031DA6D64
MRTPQQSRSSTSADRMLEATLRLLTEGGLGAVTVAAVAASAETSNGSLYHRFGDRHGLLLAAQTRAFELIATETTTAFGRADDALAAGADHLDVATALTGAAFEIFTRHRGATRAFLIESHADADHGAVSERFLHGLATTVTDWMIAHFGATRAGAESAWRILFALGVSRALLDDDQISAHRLTADELARTTGRAILGALQE